MRTIALAAIFFFGQVFVFCRLINKNVLKWCLLICKEHTVSWHTNLNRNHPALCFYPTLYFFNLRSVCLEFFRAVTSETECAKLRASRAFVHCVPTCLTCSCAFASFVPSFFYVPYVLSFFYMPSFFYVSLFFDVPYVPSSFYVPYVLSFFYMPSLEKVFSSFDVPYNFFSL